MWRIQLLVRSSCKPIIRRLLKMVPVRVRVLRACISTYKSALKEKSWSLVALHLWIRSTTGKTICLILRVNWPSLVFLVSSVGLRRMTSWQKNSIKPSRLRRIKSSKQLTKKLCGPWSPCLKWPHHQQKKNQPLISRLKRLRPSPSWIRQRSLLWLISRQKRTALSLKEWSLMSSKRWLGQVGSWSISRWPTILLVFRSKNGLKMKKKLRSLIWSRKTLGCGSVGISRSITLPAIWPWMSRMSKKWSTTSARIWCQKASVGSSSMPIPICQLWMPYLR